jgi:hypothetical protein
VRTSSVIVRLELANAAFYLSFRDNTEGHPPGTDTQFEISDWSLNCRDFWYIHFRHIVTLVLLPAAEEEIHSPAPGFPDASLLFPASRIKCVERGLLAQPGGQDCGMPSTRTKAELQEQKNKVCADLLTRCFAIVTVPCVSSHCPTPADPSRQLAHSYNELLEYVDL